MLATVICICDVCQEIYFSNLCLYPHVHLRFIVRNFTICFCTDSARNAAVSSSTSRMLVVMGWTGPNLVCFSTLGMLCKLMIHRLCVLLLASFYVDFRTLLGTCNGVGACYIHRDHKCKLYAPGMAALLFFWSYSIRPGTYLTSFVCTGGLTREVGRKMQGPASCTALLSLLTGKALKLCTTSLTDLNPNITDYSDSASLDQRCGSRKSKSFHRQNNKKFGLCCILQIYVNKKNYAF